MNGAKCSLNTLVFDLQAGFENVFRELDKDVSFVYLKNFKRARLQFSSSDFAAVARIRYDGVVISGQSIRCYFIQVRSAVCPGQSVC